jgi:hypothetical protein
MDASPHLMAPTQEAEFKGDKRLASPQTRNSGCSTSGAGSSRREGLREAITTVVNATLRARHPGIWGEGTTACAADSKLFGAWDQNLMTEWHARYGGRGVMV